MDVREINLALNGRLGNFILYKGVYTSDELPTNLQNSKPIIFIANTLKSTTDINIVGHWVCFYIEDRPVKRIVFFDSYGFSPDLYSRDFSSFVKKHSTYPFYNFKVQLQPNTSVKCGLYVIMFVHFVSHYGVDRYTFLYKNIFSKRDLTSNDKYVTRYYFKHLNKSRTCSAYKFGRKRAITFKECQSIGK